jgi:AraC-like DNA-binding protein
MAPCSPLMQPLYAHPLLRSRDGDEVRSFLRAKQHVFELEGGIARAPVNARINALYFPEGGYLSYVQYGAPATTFAEAGDYRIQFPLAGAAQTQLARRSYLCAGNDGVISSAGVAQRIRMSGDCRRIVAVFSREALARQLEALLGAPLCEPLVFDPELDLTRGAGRSLAEYLRLALRDFNRPESAMRLPLALRQFEQFSMTTLLLAHRHNYTAALGRPPPELAPRDVRRALDFMHANLGAALTLADLVAATGVPGRTLRAQFQRFKGVSPMSYLRSARFDWARAELLRRDGRSVAQIARACGFEHMGRFAVEYRRLFGESPSRSAGLRLTTPSPSARRRP